MGEAKKGALKIRFDRRLRLEFHGTRITLDAGLLACRELDDALGLTVRAPVQLQEIRHGRNIQHELAPLLRQSVYSRLAGYEDTNDAERLAQDPAMQAVVGRRALEKQAAGANTLSRFETEVLTREENLKGLSELNREWVDRAMAHSPHQRIILDMDSSESPVHGEQEGTAYNGHFRCTCYHPLFCFNQFGDCEGAMLRPGNVHSADGWRELLSPIAARYERAGVRRYFRADAAFARPEVYECLEAHSFLYAIRLPANDVVQREIDFLLTRPVGRPPKRPIIFYYDFRYQAGSWDRSRRVVAEGGMALRRTLPSRRIHCHEPDGSTRGGRALLQPARHSRAMDQGRQVRPELDTPFLSPVRVQPGAAPSLRPGVQPGQFPAQASLAQGAQALVAPKPPGQAHQNGREDCAARPADHLSIGRSSGIQGRVRHHPGPNQPITAGAGLTLCRGFPAA